MTNVTGLILIHHLSRSGMNSKRTIARHLGSEPDEPFSSRNRPVLASIFGRSDLTIYNHMKCCKFIHNVKVPNETLMKY